jgi:hypothetical protein
MTAIADVRELRFSIHQSCFHVRFTEAECVNAFPKGLEQMVLSCGGWVVPSACRWSHLKVISSPWMVRRLHHVDITHMALEVL